MATGPEEPRNQSRENDSQPVQWQSQQNETSNGDQIGQSRDLSRDDLSHDVETDRATRFEESLAWPSH